MGVEQEFPMKQIFPVNQGVTETIPQITNSQVPEIGSITSEVPQP